MRLIDLDAKEPYLLDGRYWVDAVPKATILYSLDSFNKSVPSIELMESCNRARSLFESERHGHWTPVTNGRGGFECSICHGYAPSYQDGVEWLSNYCPNCGAKMDGGKDDADE